MNPLISVVMPSYNHGKFIKKAINSVLSQTYSNFELIISDDFSKDDSKEIINSYKDKRIKKYFQKKNLGAVENMEFLVSKSKGKYISLINSDDYWHKDKLKKQINFMEKHQKVELCFSFAKVVDENDKELSEIDSEYVNVFYQQNRKKEEWLRYFWDYGNCLAHMTVFARREVYFNKISANPSLRQLPDLDLWIRIIPNYNIYIIPECLAYHRRTYGECENTSAVTELNIIRDLKENAYIRYKMILELDDNLFKKTFNDILINKNISSHIEIECEKYFILKNNSISIYMEPYAIEFFIDKCYNKEFVQTLKEKYRYKMQSFYDLTSKKYFTNTLPNNTFEKENEILRGIIYEYENSEFWKATKLFRKLIDIVKKI